MDPDRLRKRLAYNVAKLCKRNGWSAKDLADFALLCKKTAQDILHERTWPRLDSVAKVAAALKVGPKTLFARPPGEPRAPDETDEVTPPPDKPPQP